MIAWRGDGSPVLMTGPAATVFEGEWLVADDDERDSELGSK